LSWSTEVGLSNKSLRLSASYVASQNIIPSEFCHSIVPLWFNLRRIQSVINFEPMPDMDLATLKVAIKLTEASLLNNSACLAAGLGGFVDQKVLCCTA